jgi:phage protein D
MSTTNSIELGSLSKQYSARDLPAHQKLKYRDIGQAAPDEVRKDKRELRKELDEREKISSSKDNASNKRLSIADKESAANVSAMLAGNSPSDKTAAKKPK